MVQQVRAGRGGSNTQDTTLGWSKEQKLSLTPCLQPKFFSSTEEAMVWKGFSYFFCGNILQDEAARFTKTNGKQRLWPEKTSHDEMTRHFTGQMMSV